MPYRGFYNFLNQEMVIGNLFFHVGDTKTPVTILYIDRYNQAFEFENVSAGRSYLVRCTALNDAIVMEKETYSVRTLFAQRLTDS